MTTPRSPRAARATKESGPAEVLDALARLASDPETYGGFLKDAGAALQRLGLDEASRAALASGDTMRIHGAITGTAAADEAALATSRANAKAVSDILAADPAVARWLQAYYLQSAEAWRSASQPWAYYQQWFAASPATEPPAAGAPEPGAGRDD